MGIEKFGDIESMGNPPVKTDMDEIVKSIEFLWSMTRASAPGLPTGIQKFRSIEEANAARTRWNQERARRLRET